MPVYGHREEQVPPAPRPHPCTRAAVGVSGSASAAPSAEDISRWLDQLAGSSPAIDDAGRIDRIAALERLKGAIAAAQARESVEFRRSQLAAQRAAGVRREQLGRGIAGQIGLARKESPHRAGRMLTMATTLVEEMPHTMAALTRGEVSEWRASIVTTETMTLDEDQRRQVDAHLATKLGSLSDRETYGEVRRLAYASDPAAFVARARHAESERQVTVRPAPDTMSNVSARLPAKQGVAVFAGLKAAADAGVAAGDQRTRGQIMADTLVRRVTGQESAPEVPVEVNLVITDHSLFAGDSEPAELIGYGPIPAAMAREWLRGLSDQTRGWLRRIFTFPTSGQLQAVESQRRLFTAAQRRALILRDGATCRTPWCGAPIRHADHVVTHHAGGPTSLDNGQGLCSTCNHAKQAPGWAQTAGPRGAGDWVSVRTPTGHSYLSRPPPLPQAPSRSPARPMSEPPPAPSPALGEQLPTTAADDEPCRPCCLRLTTVEVYRRHPRIVEYHAA